MKLTSAQVSIIVAQALASATSSPLDDPPHSPKTPRRLRKAKKSKTEKDEYRIKLAEEKRQRKNEKRARAFWNLKGE